MEELKKEYRVFKKNVKSFFRTIKYVHNRSNIFYIVVFFDIIWCYIIYGSTENDYRIFEFEKISHSKRKTYMTTRKYNRLIRKIINKKATNIITNKELFYKRFKEYFNRDVININELSFKAFEDFAIDAKNVIARSKSSNYLNSYKEYNINSFRSPAFMEEQVRKDNYTIVEKKVSQNKSLNKLDSFVILNMVSVYNKGVDIVSSSIKFKKGYNVISGYVDVKTGKIKGRLKDQDGNEYSDMFDGFEIPLYEMVINITKDLAKELESITQVEWNFAIGNKMVYLLDANIWDDYVFLQNPEYLKNRIGLMNYYKKIM